MALRLLIRGFDDHRWFNPCRLAEVNLICGQPGIRGTPAHPLTG